MQKPTPKEMIQAIEAEADGWIASNTCPIGAVETMEIEAVRQVLILRAAADFIRKHSRRVKAAA